MLKNKAFLTSLTLLGLVSIATFGYFKSKRQQLQSQYAQNIQEINGKSKEAASGSKAAGGGQDIAQSERKRPDIVDYEELLINDLFLLGYIDKDDDGLISFYDLDRLVRIIQKHAYLRVAQRLDDLAEERLSYIEKNRMHMYGGPPTEYRKMVLESINAEQEQYSQICDRICNVFEIDHACFVESIQKHQTESEYRLKWENTTQALNEKKDIWSKQYSHSSSQEKELSYEETKKIFLFQCKLHCQTYDNLNNIKDQTLKEDSQVYNHLMADTITLEYKVTSSQLNHAVETHKILEDEECKRELDRSSMPSELQQRILEAYNRCDDEYERGSSQHGGSQQPNRAD